MNISFFLEHLKAQKNNFSQDVLAKHEFEAEDIQDIMDDFTPKRKPFNSISKDVLIKLIEEYEIYLGFISAIAFFEEVKYDQNYAIIGSLRAEDNIAIELKAGEVVLLSGETGEIIYRCAENSSKFMAAFLEHGISTLGMEFESEQKRAEFLRSRITKAVMVAGGEKFRPFWEILYPINIKKPDNLN